MTFDKPQKGFTIIEVLIVLAIAGLILLVIFLAVPALQRNARNTQRKQDVTATLALVQENILLNNNQLPHSCNTSQHWCFLRDANLGYYDNHSTENAISYWNRSSVGPFNDDSDTQIDPDSPTALDHVSIRSWAKCNGGLLTGENAGRRDVAAQFAIETASGGGLLCLEM